MTNEELGQLYERYGFLIHRRCAAILGDAQDANDALQETFMRVQRYPPRNVQSMLGWLYGVATRVCLDQLQSRKRSEAWPDKLLGRLRELTGGVTEQQSDMRMSLGSELMKLDERSREIAVLHFLDGMTQEEIAERTGYSRKTVGVKLKAAEEKLRTALDSSLQDGGAECPTP